MHELQNYTQRDFHLFIDDMRMAGVEPYHYRGRNFWQEPAVEAESIQAIAAITSVECQWDNLGLDCVVYPKARDNNITDGPYERPKHLEGDLRICHIPQVPAHGDKDIFRVPVKTLREAQLVYDTITSYDLFQYDRHIKPDYANMCDLEVFEDGEWIGWYNEDGDDFHEYLARIPDECRISYTLKFEQ